MKQKKKSYGGKDALVKAANKAAEERSGMFPGFDFNPQERTMTPRVHKPAQVPADRPWWQGLTWYENANKRRQSGMSV